VDEGGRSHDECGTYDSFYYYYYYYYYYYKTRLILKSSLLPHFVEQMRTR